MHETRFEHKFLEGDEVWVIHTERDWRTSDVLPSAYEWVVSSVVHTVLECRRDRVYLMKIGGRNSPEKHMYERVLPEERLFTGPKAAKAECDRRNGGDDVD